MSELIQIHCAKPPFPGRPSSWCPRSEGAAPPLLRGEGLVYRNVFRGAMTGRCLASGGVRLRRQGTGNLESDRRMMTKENNSMLLLFQNSNLDLNSNRTWEFCPKFYIFEVSLIWIITWLLLHTITKSLLHVITHYYPFKLLLIITSLLHIIIKPFLHIITYYYKPIIRYYHKIITYYYI